MRPRHWILWTLLALVADTASAVCIKSAVTERLSVLHVESCLFGASAKKSVVSELHETLTNIGSEDIILELHPKAVYRFRVDITRDWQPVSIEPLPPVLHNANDPWYAKKESIPLAPGQSVTLKVSFAELMREPPKRRAKYRIAITHSYPWRRKDEPEGQAFRLRQEEDNARDSYVETVRFEDVRLK